MDISNAIAGLLSVKEETEVLLLKKASQITVEVYQKYLRDQIMDIIDSDKVQTVGRFFLIHIFLYLELFEARNFLYYAENKTFKAGGRCCECNFG